MGESAKVVEYGWTEFCAGLRGGECACGPGAKRRFREIYGAHPENPEFQRAWKKPGVRRDFCAWLRYMGRLAQQSADARALAGKAPLVGAADVSAARAQVAALSGTRFC